MENSNTNNKEMQKRENTILFINAVQQMLNDEALKEISIRKIARHTGFHNSTIYLYFEDLDQLIMLASMKYFQEYSRMLEVQSKKKQTPAENFYTIWDSFFDTILEKPDVFYNFFFGKHSSNLNEVMNLYYEIFPEEYRQLSESIKSMYFGRNISERSLSLLCSLIPDTNNVTNENLNMLNEVIVSYCKYKLEQKCQNPDLDSQSIKKDFLTAMTYITGISNR